MLQYNWRQLVQKRKVNNNITTTTNWNEIEKKERTTTTTETVITKMEVQVKESVFWKKQKRQYRKENEIVIEKEELAVEENVILIMDWLKQRK